MKIPMLPPSTTVLYHDSGLRIVSTAAGVRPMELTISHPGPHRTSVTLDVHDARRLYEALDDFFTAERSLNT